ncbi:conjugal transfer protein [Thermomonospora amylolytica]|uniref:conjugal transfer protein n=1 Tax=Thermomonospora amylolytica TaxID=1411117 RepID=UPI001F2B2946|nr:conjugal transfer protein [Thermomonospora amylolytica]
MTHGGDTDVHDDAMTGFATGAPAVPQAPDDGSRKGRRGRGSGSGGGRWAGSGGRWWVWVGRALLWALIIVIVVNGVRAPFERFTQDGGATPAATTPPPASRFPVAAASAFALQFGDVYLNYDEQTAADRERRLRAFLPEGSIGQFGWNGAGSLRVESTQVADVQVRDEHNAVVTLLARAEDRWLSLAVPVYASNGALVVSGRPALLPPPALAALPQGGVGERDPALENELRTALFGSFFPAYAASDTAALSRFTDGAPITGLGGSVTFVRLGEVVAPRGAADRRTVTVTVTWRLPAQGGGPTAAELEQTYEFTVVKKDGTWYVRDIRGAGRPTGP